MAEWGEGLLGEWALAYKRGGKPDVSVDTLKELEDLAKIAEKHITAQAEAMRERIAQQLSANPELAKRIINELPFAGWGNLDSRQRDRITLIIGGEVAAAIRQMKEE